MAAALAAVTCGIAAGHAQSRPLVAPAAAAIYARLLPQIERIRIFDHHSHPGWADDQDVDPAAPPPGAALFRLTPDNLDWVAAARVLFKFPFADLTGNHRRWLAQAKAERRRALAGTAYFDNLLDRLGIETVLANRIAMSDYLDPARFRWVFYADPFMYPLDNSSLAGRNPDMRAFMPMQSKTLQRYARESGAPALPQTFNEYLAFVSTRLEAFQKQGAVAAKFEAAYFRSLRFEDPPREEAAAVYERFRAGGTPGDAGYTSLQDVIFRHIVSECGRLHLAVHIHTSAGAGESFSLRNVNVLNLENIVHDPRYASTTFVLIHGGYPFDREAGFVAVGKNVYLDSSATGSFILFPNEFKDVLRRWFELVPDKVTFGSDAFPLDDTLGVEETYWFGVRDGRTAAAAALAEMVAAREISEATALRFARGYLHDNAARLYPAAPAGPNRR